MSRYIDADALMQDVIAHSYPLTNAFSVGGVDDWMFVTGIQQVVDEQPTVDAVQVVRCRDCKHRVVNEHYGEKGYIDLKAYCEFDTEDIFELGRHAADDDWFCADGERRTDEQQT